MDRHTPPRSQPVPALGQYFVTTLDRAGREAAPPTFEDLAAYVNGTLDDADREIVESHLEEDAALRAEVEDLRALAGAMREARTLAAGKDRIDAGVPGVRPFEPASRRRTAAIWRRGPLMAWAAAAMVVGAVTWLAVRTARVVPPTAPPSASTGTTATADATRSPDATRATDPARSPDVAPGAAGAAHAPSASSAPAAPAAPSAASPASAPPAAIHVRDAGRVVIVDPAAGAITGLIDDRPATARMVFEALTAGILPRASARSGLEERALTLMSGDERLERFTPIAPVATIVRDTRPAFRWSPHPGARAYVVTIYSENFDKVLTSPPVRDTRWSATADLTPGAIYQWQVLADTPGGPVRAPVPPASDARFRVMDAEARRTLERELARTRGSHLLTGLLLARAGVLDEAEHAFTMLLADNPDSAPIKTLLTRVREQHR